MCHENGSIFSYPLLECVSLMVYGQKFGIPNHKTKRVLGVPRKHVLNAIYSHGRGRQIFKDTVETLAFERLTKNVHMQGFRSPEE